MRGLPVFVGLVAAAILAGCVLITGGTNGYSEAEGGLSSQGCHSPKDCNGGVCCFEVPDSGLPSATCQASCPAWQQSCAIGMDCDGGECLAQSCTVEGTTVQVTTCGAISFCTQ
jgi:hypothetical protein